MMTLSIRTQQGRTFGEGRGRLELVFSPATVRQSLAGQGLTGCSMTLSTVLLMSAMASVYTAASSWISLWF